MLPDYNPIFRKYNEQLKPLISEIEGREERFSQPLLLNLAGVYDYMSIAAAEGQDSKECLEKADELVDLCIAQSYMSLIYAIRKNTDAFEKSLGKKGLRRLDNGQFVGRYLELKMKRKELLKKARYIEERQALPLFKNAYEVVTEMEDMVNHGKANMSLIQTETSSWWATAVKWILSVIISVVAGVVVKYYLG